MRTLLVSCLVAGLTVLAGCGDGGTPGGPGVSKDGKEKGTGEGIFNIDVPLLSTTVTQGGSATATIGLDRGTNFDEDVTLTFDNLPQGVTVEPQEAQIKASEETVKVTIKAAKDAALGDFEIKVTGKPTAGADATHKLSITVAAMEKPEEKAKEEGGKEGGNEKEKAGDNEKE